MYLPSRDALYVEYNDSCIELEPTWFSLDMLQKRHLLGRKVVVLDPNTTNYHGASAVTPNYSILLSEHRLYFIGRVEYLQRFRTMAHIISNAFRLKSEAGATPIIVATVITTFVAITASRFAFQKKKIKVIKSPAATLLPTLSQAEKEALPYPPDAFPGGRDVESPVWSTIWARLDRLQ